jgi:hypothetical protein
MTTSALDMVAHATFNRAVSDGQTRVLVGLALGAGGAGFASDVASHLPNATDAKVARQLGELVSKGYVRNGGVRPIGKAPDGRYLRRTYYELEARVRPGRQVVTYIVQREAWVKIGRTANLPVRLVELARFDSKVLVPVDMDMNQPLITLAVLDHDVEDVLHEEFAPCRVIGEWFLPDPDMKQWLDAIAAPTAVAA